MSGTARDCLVVIPTYCERENLGAIAPAVLSALPADLLIVDDDSPDGTGELADDLAHADDRLKVLHRAGRPRGLGPAYQDGFQFGLASGYRFIVQMDADFSHQPAALPALRAAAEDCDLVIGSRWVKGGRTRDWPLSRKMLSRGGSVYARAILGLPVKDTTSGFKCWRSDALARLGFDALFAQGFAFQIEMNYRALKAGLSIREVPIEFVDRTLGQSKMSWRITAEALWAVWRIRMRGGR
jgi:dolichol-phosphate mannosyltransferase